MLKDNTKFRIEIGLKNHTFKGTDKAKDILESFIDSGNIVVYLDPDVDGLLSGILVMRYLISRGVDFKWYINSNREHGWTLDFDKAKNHNIIAVDFLLNPDELKSIVNNNVNILSIDHHENVDEFIEYTSDSGNYGIVINNQYPFEDEDGRYLSGAGVVFEVLREIDNDFDTEENRAIVGITLLSDVRQIENKYARGYLNILYNHKCKGYIGYLIENTIGERDYGFGVPRMDRNYVDFKFSPAINSCLRFNQEDHVVKFLMGSGFLNLDYREAQKNLVRNIQDSVLIKDYSHLRVCYFMEEDVIPEYRDVLSSFVGLVASKFLDGKRSVICYVISKKDGKPFLRRASFRGNINGLEYRRELLGTINGLGHGSAFGIKEMMPSHDLFKKANIICSKVEMGSHYKKNITDVLNLSFFVNRKGFEYGERNMYLLTQNRLYLRYIGRNIERKRTGGNYAEYSVDGVSVLCFENDVDFSNGLILPINERGMLCMYLESYANLDD